MQKQNLVKKSTNMAYEQIHWDTRHILKFCLQTSNLNFSFHIKIDAVFGLFIEFGISMKLLFLTIQLDNQPDRSYPPFSIFCILNSPFHYCCLISGCQIFPHDVLLSIWRCKLVRCKPEENNGAIAQENWVTKENNPE